MIQPGIKPRSPGPLANTLGQWPNKLMCPEYDTKLCNLMVKLQFWILGNVGYLFTAITLRSIFTCSDSSQKELFNDLLRIIIII